MNEQQKQVIVYMKAALEDEDCYINEAWESVKVFVLDAFADIEFDQHSVEVGDLVEATNGLEYYITSKQELTCSMQFTEKGVDDEKHLHYHGIPYSVIRKIIKRKE